MTHGKMANIPPPPPAPPPPGGFNIPPPPHPSQLPLPGAQAGGVPQQQRPLGQQHVGHPVHQQSMNQPMGQQHPGVGNFNGGFNQQQQQMAAGGAQNQFGPQQYGLTSPQLGLSSRPLFKGFEFSKPSLRDVENGERPSWLMVTSADKLDISSADIERRIKNRRANTKKTALDEYNNLPSPDMRFLIKKLIDDLNLMEPNQLKEWNFQLIETDKREYLMGRSRVRDIGTMRVYLKQSTKAELRDMTRTSLQRSMSLGGSIDLSGPRISNGFQQNPGFGMQGNNMGPQGGFHAGQGMMPGMHGGVMPGQAGGAFMHPGQQGFGNGGASGAAGKAGKPNFPPGGPNGNNGAPAATNIKVVTNNKAADKKKSGSKDRDRKRSKSSQARGRSRHDLDSSDSDSDSDSRRSSSESELEDRVEDVEKKMRRLSKNVERITLGRRASTSTRLPRAPMAPARRASEHYRQPVSRHPSFERRRTSPINIQRRSPKMIERVYLSSDSGRDHGYASSDSMNSWVGGESAFSRPDSDYTPPSSYGSRSGLFSANKNPFETYREHRKPSARGFASPSLSPGASEYDRDYDGHRRRRASSRHSNKYLPGTHADYGGYFDVPRRKSSTRGHDYRRQSEDADDQVRARRQREERDRYLRDERYRQSSRAH